MLKARLALLLALPLLAACEEMGEVGGAPRSLALAGGISVRGPQGYCINPAASQAAAGFAVLGACDLFGGQSRAQNDGLISVQVGAEGTAFVAGSEETVVSYLRGAGGRASLSHRKRAEDIRVEAVQAQEGLVLVRFEDAAQGGLSGMQRTAWRAFLDVKGHAVTVSLRGYARTPLSDAAGAQLLGQAAQALLQANR